MTSSWLRRNAAALIAAAVLVPATALVIGGNEWWGYYSGQPVVPVTAGPGETVGFGGASYGPATITVLEDDPDDELPEGVKVLAVEVPVRPGDAPAGCGRPTLRELSGEGRLWTDATLTVELPFDEDASWSCDSERTGAYTVAVPFLVPDDVSGPLGLDFTVADELPRFLRLVVDVP